MKKPQNIYTFKKERNLFENERKIERLSFLTERERERERQTLEKLSASGAQIFLLSDERERKLIF